MKNYFSMSNRHTVTEANINYYATPFIHPERTMKEHDFIYMLNGEWKFGQGQEEYCLTKDTLLILGANHKHFGISPSTPNTKTMYFHVKWEEGDQCGYDLPQQSTALNSFIDVSYNRNIKKIFHEIVSSKLRGDELRTSVLFDLLICELTSARIHTPDAGIAEQIKNIICRSPEKFYSNSELAKMLGISVKTAENKFKALFGTTIHRYILEFKIEQAISYFKNFPEMQIKEISYNLGFYDEYHFSKQFKSLTGVSPSNYKKSLF